MRRRVMSRPSPNRCANGVFSSRRIERATWRDIGARFIAANTHPDHDTIATFRRTNKQAFEAAFLQVLLLARESGLEVPITSDLHASFREIEYLRGSIGRTGLLALKPLQVTSGRDLWHRYVLAYGKI